MPNAFTRLFTPSRKAADGLTQSQREAIVDLLYFCMYADKQLTLDEEKVIDEEAGRFNWEPGESFESYATRSISRVREAVECPDERPDFLSQAAARLSSPEVKNRALALCRKLFGAKQGKDGREQAIFEEIRKTLRI